MASPITFKKEDSPQQGASFMQAAYNAVVSNSVKLQIITAEEALEMGIPFRVLTSGYSNTGKTHFSLTFPPPIRIIDTEGRYPLILPKFRTCADCNENFVSSDINPKTGKKNGIKDCPSCASKNIKVKDVAGIRCKTGNQVIQAAEIFYKQLNEHFEKTGEYGTLVVDNVSKKWDWDQTEYSVKKYGSEPIDHMDPMGDYKFINPQHNEKFRDLILSGSFHVVMIATLKENYDKDNRYKIIGTKPDGQKHNPFAVDWNIVNEEGMIQLQDGTLVGNGVFTSYIKKNSLVSAMINPVQSLSYEKLVTIRKKLFVECGVTEEPMEEKKQ